MHRSPYLPRRQNCSWGWDQGPLRNGELDSTCYCYLRPQNRSQFRPRSGRITQLTEQIGGQTCPHPWLSMTNITPQQLCRWCHSRHSPFRWKSSGSEHHYLLTPQAVLLESVPREISIPITSTYSFQSFKPLYSVLKQPKQTKADQCRPRQTKADQDRPRPRHINVDQERQRPTKTD